EHAPLLKPRSSNEYDFMADRGEAVWITVENLSVYVKREDEGVVADIFIAGKEDEESLAGSWATYAEGMPDDDDEIAHSADEPPTWLLHHNESADEWSVSRNRDSSGVVDELETFEWGQDALN